MTPDRTKLRIAAHAAREMPSEVVLALLDQLEAAEDCTLAAEVASRSYREQAERAEAQRDAIAAKVERWPFRAMDGTGL